MIVITAIFQAIHLAALLLMFGFAAFFLLVAMPVVRKVIGGAGNLKEFYEWSARWLTFMMMVAIAAEIGCFCIQTISISGLPLWRALSVDTLEIVGTQTSFGRQCLLRLTTLVFAGGYLLLKARNVEKPSSTWMMQASAVSAVLLFSVTLASHAAAGGGGALRWALVAVYAIHVIASAVWLGGLVPFAYILASTRRSYAGPWVLPAKEITQRFSTVALISVGLLMITGLLNAWIFVGSFSALATPPYGYLLILKMLLFATMLGVAAQNKFAITPQLDISSGLKRIYAFRPLRKLYRNVVLESVLGLAVILVATLLGLSPPAIH